MLIGVIQVLILWLSMVAAAVILIYPPTLAYALQFFAAAVIAFVVINRLGRKKQFDAETVLEQKNLNLTWQLFCVGLAIFLLIGYTGGLGSAFFPLVFIYLFFVILACLWPVSLAATLASLVFLYFLTPEFGENYYGTLFSVVIFLPIAFFAQSYYAKFLKEQRALEAEREKLTYYNLYAEKQQEALLGENKSVPKVKQKNADSASNFLQELVPELDELQKESRFPENQMVVSARLTKLALKVRQVLKQA